MDNPYKRWLILAAGIVANICQGVAYTASIFMLPLGEALNRPREAWSAEWGVIFAMSLAFLPLGMLLSGKLADKATGIGEHGAPFGGGRLDAQTDIAQRGGDDQAVGDSHCHLDYERRDGVGDYMPEDDAEFAAIDGFCRFNKLNAAHRQDVGADHTREVGDAADTHREHGLEKPRAQRGGYDNGQQHLRDGVEKLQKAHDQHIRFAAEETGDRPAYQPAPCRDGDRDQADGQREARAVQHPGEDISPQLVGAEPVLRRGELINTGGVDQAVGISADPRGEDSQYRDKHQNAESHNGLRALSHLL